MSDQAAASAFPTPTKEAPALAGGWARISPRPHEWALLVAGLLLVNHYAWLLDDAFVYFRYVDNWVLLDHGLVYNRGEYVEGYTSPAWTLLLASVRWTGLDYWHIVRGLGALHFTAFWWMMVVLNRDLSPGPASTEAGANRSGEDEPLIVNFPLIYLTLSYGVLCYFTSGVEAPLVQLAAAAYALYFVRPERMVPTLLVGLSTLIRPELALAFAIAFAWTWARTRRPPLRLAAVAILGVGGWLVFRVIYYAELLPNTFYLKDLPDWGQGLVYLHETAATYGVYGVAIVFAAIVFALHRGGVRLDGAPRIAMLAVAAAVAVYFVRVGGDPRHYRYLAFSFCLAAASLAGLTEHALASFMPALPRTARGQLVIATGGLLVALVVVTRHPPQLGAHPVFGDVPHTMQRGINDAAYHRNHERLAISPWSMERVQPTLPTPLSSNDYTDVTNTGWCEWAYRLPHLRVIQNLGLTEPILARVDMPADRPAHKSGLQPLAADIEAIHRRYTAAPGMYRMAVADGVAAPWIQDNLETIEIIERKIYNRHDPIENIGLALRFPARIQP